MANVKGVKIEGKLNVIGVMDTAGRREEDHILALSDMVRYQNVPEDKASDAKAAAKVIRDFMAQTVAPYFGLNMEFDKDNMTIKKNKADGQVRYIQFVIEGQEAVAWAYLKVLIHALKQWCDNGNVFDLVSDIEG